MRAAVLRRLARVRKLQHDRAIAAHAQSVAALTTAADRLDAACAVVTNLPSGPTRTPDEVDWLGADVREAAREWDAAEQRVRLADTLRQQASAAAERARILHEREVDACRTERLLSEQRDADDRRYRSAP